jgi:NAD(P)-dependent dehydrogenase (short-subunit alcohol dehydrogenase family)
LTSHASTEHPAPIQHGDPSRDPGPESTDRPVATPSLSELISLTGRVAVVTGAAVGVGAAISARLVEAGARVVLADLDEAGARGRAAALHETRAAGHVVDVSAPESVRELADFTRERFGEPDVWVNNAGIYPRAGVLDMRPEQWRRVLDTNLDGAFYGSQAAARMMATRGGGVIVNIASASAFRAPSADLSHYVAAKAGIVGLTRGLAVELGPLGIRVLAVAPVLVPTRNALHLLGTQDAGAAVEATAARIPLRRVPQPDDIARVVLFAVSGLASMMSGSTLLVDGGQLAG